MFSLNSTRSQVPRARDLAHAHAADEQVAFPLRQLAARVERHAGDRDRRRPVHDGIDEALARETFRLPRPRVRAPQAHERPAVVAAGLQHVDLVAAVRAVLVLPDLARARMHRDSHAVAMAQREHLGRAVLAGERVAGRGRAVVAQPQHFAGVRRGVLRRVVVAAATSYIGIRRGRTRGAPPRRCLPPRRRAPSRRRAPCRPNGRARARASRWSRRRASCTRDRRSGCPRISDAARCP